MKRCGHDDDELFLDRVRAARSVDWSGAEAEDFWREEMRKLIRALRPLFRELEEGEVFTRTWEVVQKLDLDRAKDCPRGWVIKTASYRLEDLRKDEVEKPEKLLERLNQLERPVVASAPADAFLDEAPFHGQEIRVWDVITEELVARFRWPDDEAARVVAAFQEHVEEAVFDDKPFPTVETIANKLPDLPRGMKRPVLRFVFGHHGFLWALLKGIDPNRALCLDGVKDELESIIWPVAAQGRALALAVGAPESW